MTDLPTIAEATRAIRNHLCAEAMNACGGNITRAALKLGTSRRVLREALKDGGVYPWPGETYSPVDWEAVLRQPVAESAGVTELPEVKGVVQLKDEWADDVTGAPAGPVLLFRGEGAVPLWPGRWVSYHRAKSYAERHGHAFSSGG